MAQLFGDEVEWLPAANDINPLYRTAPGILKVSSGEQMEQDTVLKAVSENQQMTITVCKKGEEYVLTIKNLGGNVLKEFKDSTNGLTTNYMWVVDALLDMYNQGYTAGKEKADDAYDLGYNEGYSSGCADGNVEFD